MEKLVNKKQLGKKIKIAREEHKYTQFELSEILGISPNYLGDIERGVKKPSLEVLIRICNTMKLSLDYLFSDSLDNIISEEEDIIYTDKQMAIIRNIIKNISDNF